MSPKESSPRLPESVALKLRLIRRRAIATALARGVFLTLALLAGVVLSAMLLDLVAGWFSHAARTTVSILALTTVGIAGVVWCLKPLLRRGSLVATAREVDEALPELEERWSTVTELSQSADSPEIRGSHALIREVRSESERASKRISAATVVSARPAIRASRWFAAAAVALILFFAVNFGQATLLLERLLLPGSDISLTRVTASPADGWVAKGEPLTLQARVEGRLPGKAPTLFIRTQDTTRAIAMTATNGSLDTFRSHLPEVADTFEYRVRTGDGQTPWHRISAVNRPAITAVQLKVSPPTYTSLPVESRDSLPSSLRVLEGSDLELAFQSDQSLDRMLLDLGDGQTVQLSSDGDNWYRFRSRPTNSFALAATAINRFQLENRNRPVCRVHLYADRPPAVRILDPTDDDTAIPPEDTVEVTFEASDDFGLAKAEMLLAITKADGTTNSVTLPVELGADAGKKEIRKTLPLNPKSLGLQQGDQLSYVIQVTDTRQSPAQATAGDPSMAASRESNEAATAGTQADPTENPSSNPDPQLATKPSDPATPSPENPDAKQQAGSTSTAGGESKPSSLAAKSPTPSEDSKTPQGSQRPPNDMAMRTLDAGQSTACKPRNLLVDEWAGSFDGDKRKKLEIAIEPILQNLAVLLATAQSRTDELKPAAGSPDGVSQARASSLTEAKKNLVEATVVITNLQFRTKETPYAFIGLQLRNIDAAHITPAHDTLKRLVIGSMLPGDQPAILEKGSFHIARAREMLADLTRTFESVRRDQQVADAMQKLNKMYQIFLEDTQNLLGSSRSPIHSYDRKVAEVDEAFVEKLKALLEEKKKIMAELAKVLADDPRLLRRYLAMLGQQGTSYRDQLTLLAEDQKKLKEQVDLWNATPEGDRAALVPRLRESYAQQSLQVARDAARLRENMETWLPLDVKPDEPKIQSALARAEKIVAQTAVSNGPEKEAADQRALEEIRKLREDVLQFSDIASTNQARLGAYVANRLPEIEALLTAHSGQMKIQESLRSADFAKVGEIVQQRLTEQTVALGEKLDASEGQLADMSPEIATKARELTTILHEEIITPQRGAVDQLAQRDVATAGSKLDPVVPAFARAEAIFDDLMRLVVAKLDEAPAPDSVESAQDLESILALLQEEMKAAEGLGISCRPINVSVIKDWMRPGQNPGQGMGQGKGQGQGRAQAQAAQSQAERGKAETSRLERQARKSAGQALADARAPLPESDQGVRHARGEDWNKLASKLQNDLLQGRDNTPPEQYRSAIENYFRILSDAPAANPR